MERALPQHDRPRTAPERVDRQHTCGSIVDGVPKSNLTHHYRVLRDAGIIWQRPSGRETLQSLRREDLDARFPGLLDSLLGAARREAEGSTAARR